MGLRRQEMALSSCVRRTRGPAGIPGTTPTGFSPLSLSPALWLKADVGTLQTVAGTAAAADADPVGQWLDQSGNGNHVSQATASKRPTLKLAIKNGLPVLRFDGVDDFLSANFARSQPQTVFCVSVVSDASNRTIYDSPAAGNSGRLYSQPGTNEHLSTFAGITAVTNTTAAQGSWAVSAAMFSGAASTLFVNGVTTTGNAGTDQGSGIVLGAFGTGALAFLKGDIGELIVCSGDLSANIPTVAAYLNGRYGVY